MTVDRAGPAIVVALIATGAFLHGAVEPHVIGGIAVVLLLLALHRVGATMTGLDHPLDRPVALFALLAAASIFWSVSPESTRRGLEPVGAAVITYWLLSRQLTRRRQARSFATTFLIVGAIYATLGLVIRETDVLGLPVFTREGERLALTFVNPNHFAGFLAPIAWLGVGVGLGRTGARRFLFLFLSAWVAVAVLFSGSRGATIALVAGLLTLLFLIRLGRLPTDRLRGALAVPMLVGGLLILIGTTSYLERLRTMSQPLVEASRRFLIWDGTLQLIATRPLFGSGLGTYADVYPAVQPDELAGAFVTHAHNDWLELAAEIGLVGLLVALVGLAIAGRQLLVALADDDRPGSRELRIGATAGLVATLVHAVGEFSLRIPANALVFVAALVIAGRPIEPTRTDRPASGRLAALAVLLVFGFSLASSLAGDRLLSQAHRLQRDEEFEAAEARLTTVQRLRPLDPTPLERRAAIDWQLAISEPDQKVKSERLDEAASALGRAIALSPVRDDFHRRLALVELERENHTAARAGFERAVELAPTNAIAHFELGSYRLRFDSVEPAIPSLAAAVRLDPDLLPVVLAQMIARGAGLADWRRVVPRGPARTRFGHWLIEHNLASEGLRELRNAVDDARSAAEHLRGLADAERFAESIPFVDEYTATFPDDSEIRFRAASLLQRAGEGERAIPHLERHVELEPDRATPAVRLARAYRRHHRCADIDRLEPAVRRHPSNANLLLEVALCSRQNDDQERAWTLLRQAAVAEPGRVDLQFELGRQAEAVGRADRAVEAFRACLDLDPANERCRAAALRLATSP